jgi:hypothetical protein
MRRIGRQMARPGALGDIGYRRRVTGGPAQWPWSGADTSPPILYSQNRPFLEHAHRHGRQTGAAGSSAAG